MADANAPQLEGPSQPTEPEPPVVKPKIRPIDPNRLGMKQLYQPPNNDEIDIE
jgi:hypothetical protein